MRSCNNSQASIITVAAAGAVTTVISCGIRLYSSIRWHVVFFITNHQLYLYCYTYQEVVLIVGTSIVTCILVAVLSIINHQHGYITLERMAVGQSE